MNRSFAWMGMLLVSWSGQGLACQCPPSHPLFSKMMSTVVFMGTVLDIKLVHGPTGRWAGWHHNEVRFQVLEDWKGAPFDTILFGTNPGGGDCGYHFHLGGTYVVYA